jgi:protein phosphatase
VLTRALGVRKAIAPDLAELTPQAGDVYLLCSDGLTTHVQDADILDAVLDNDDPQLACDLLVEAANRRGGVDNITVLIMRFDK